MSTPGWRSDCKLERYWVFWSAVTQPFLSRFCSFVPKLTYLSATNIVSRRPGTCRYLYHNIRNILYKSVLNFYLKFCSSRMGRSRLMILLVCTAWMVHTSTHSCRSTTTAVVPYHGTSSRSKFRSSNLLNLVLLQYSSTAVCTHSCT